QRWRRPPSARAKSSVSAAAPASLLPPKNYSASRLEAPVRRFSEHVAKTPIRQGSPGFLLWVDLARAERARLALRNPKQSDGGSWRRGVLATCSEKRIRAGVRRRGTFCRPCRP